MKRRRVGRGETRGGDPPPRGQREASTSLHELRLDAVVRHLAGSGAASVIDLGCGSGALLERLLGVDQFTRIVGIDSSARALTIAERLRDAAGAGDRLTLRHGSIDAPDRDLVRFDAAAMVEVIEHVPPAHLSRVERAVFAILRPRFVVLTTPNREYNELLGKRDGELRHADHRFEWSRSKFESWGRGVAQRNGYQVEFEPVGPGSAWLGSPSQMALFRRDG